VFGFDTTHEALEAERALLEAQVHAVPIPTPRSLGAHCGIALRIAPGDERAAAAILERAGIEPQARTEIEDV